MRLFPPLRRGKTAVLEEGKGEHRHECVSVQPGPGSALEVVEAEFLLQLLVGLLAGPARLDRRRKHLEGGVSGKVGEGVLRLARRPALTDNPSRAVLSTLAGQVLGGPAADHLGRAVGNPDPGGSEVGGSRPFVPRRHVTFRQAASARTVSAERES